MPPPMSRRSALVSRLAMTPSLSDTLEPPRTTTYGPRRVVGRLAQRRDLLEDELADRVREHQRDVVDRRLLAVHDAEAVGDERRRRARRARPPARHARRRPWTSRGGRTGCSPAGRSRRPAARRRSPWRESPTTSVASATGWPSSSASRSATGLSEYLSSGAPLGRPRWAVTTTRAPAASSAWSVGRAARTRPSSVMVVPSSGTLKSERTSTRLPRRSPRSSMVFMRLLPVTRAGADTAASACARATGAGAHADA